MVSGNPLIINTILKRNYPTGSSSIGNGQLTNNYYWINNGGNLLNFRPSNKQILFNWAAFYKPNSLPSSTVGSSSAPGLIAARKRRT